ncbi:prolyl 4-hydroxylase subunit alpha [Paenibacillus elgii]|uniref:Prolyl 4-hydroxylase subunit alpha n=1 Tax=Paenibacillus elgii TaxID=189691 RepID=A0A165QR08_9BACL|nr:2OG-Fe(II) oxygenase [Paenibacillus elgii]KZE76104.1 prolyl 4-hydroxylase subunit alpha [Paenibacillus elgii]
MTDSISKRVAGLDWTSIQQALDEQGFAAFPPLLQNDECRVLISMYEEESHFRTRIDMARYRFGIGEYKYFQAPLPSLLQELRVSFYPRLAEAANRWQRQLGQEAVYPPELAQFLERCHEHGQTRPTPLLLKYEAGGYNCLHQDMYGDIFFPFQVVFVLNQREKEYAGGEFLLVEQRPRAQSRGHAIALEQGAGLIFPTQHRPVQGTRGTYRTTLRHGVSTITSGTRYSLGLIFHDAQ